MTDYPKWLIPKRYPHLDLPCRRKNEFLHLMSYVKTPDAIAKHAFLPLIRRNVITYPFKRENVESPRKKVKKVRPITYASHTDSAIYSYYALLLSSKYEESLGEANLSDSVCAYRKIPCKEENRNKCNIDIAKEVFEFIKDGLSEGHQLAAVTFDIKGFFDNLDHKLLKQAWKNVMGYEHMPDDVYNVFKSVTKYSYVSEKALFHECKNHIICKNATGYKKRMVKRLSYLRDKDAVAFCDKSDIHHLRDIHLIKTRKKTDVKGIPQGLPISAALANVYMFGFDKKINEKISKIGGLYRRYSDDIIIVCSLNEGKESKEYVCSEIKNLKLEIESHKTNLFSFIPLQDKNVCSHEIVGEKKKLEYLGFSFDGNRILLKDAGLGKYYLKFDLSFRRAFYRSTHANNKYWGHVFENKLIKKFSYAGAKTHKRSSKKEKNKFEWSKKSRTHGNYLTYVRKASKIMDSPAIERQLRHSVPRLRKRLVNLKDSVDKVTRRKQVFEFLKYGKIYH
jgi:hypothetical protein